MKFIVAIIRPAKLEAVRIALSSMNVTGMTVTEVRGYGRQQGHTEIYRGAEYEISFVPKIKLEIAVSSDIVESVVEAIEAAAKDDKIGAGKIFVLTIDQAVRVRTGETGESAL